MQGKYYHEPVIVGTVHSINYNKYENNVIEIKPYHSKKPLIKLNHTGKISHFNLKKSDTWKIQLVIAINFVSSENACEEHEMRSKSSRSKIMLETPMRRRVFDCTSFLQYKYHKINMKQGR